MPRIFLLLALSLIANAVAAQTKLSCHTRRVVAANSLATRAVDSQMIPAYIHIEPQADLAELEKLGVELNVRTATVCTARIPAYAIEAVAALDIVRYVQAAEPVQPMLDLVRPAVAIDSVHAGHGLAQPFTGRGVVVGIIDSGFDYTHPAFYDSNRSTLRISRVWEQSLADGTPPAGFTYGGELSTPETILAAAGDVTTNSHGTHVAAIAAGADSAQLYQGMAPEAEIVLVSTAGAATPTNVNISDAIAYIYAYADAVGRPCVINMSLGNQLGPHDGTSTFDQIADQLQGAGRLIAGSVGNFGARKLHASKTFADGAADTLRTFVDYIDPLSTANVGGDIDIWGSPGMDLTVNVMTYNVSRQRIGEQMTLTVTDGEAPTLTQELSGAVGTMSAYGEVSPLNGKPHVLVSSAISGLRSGYAIAIEVVSSTGGVVNIWADGNDVTLTDNSLPGWTDGDTNSTLAEIGGTGHNLITVGAYTTRSSILTENMGTVETGETPGAVASFSGQGPTVDGRMKPDICAPGCYTISAISTNDASVSSYPIASYFDWRGHNRYYAYMQGSSMASPVVAGIMATWLEANPTLTPDDIRAILRSTARRPAEWGETVPVMDNLWGQGMVDAWAGIVEALDMATSIASPDAPDATADLAIEPTADGSIAISGNTHGHAVTVGIYSLDGRLIARTTLSADAIAAGATVATAPVAASLCIVRATYGDRTQACKVSIR